MNLNVLGRLLLETQLEIGYFLNLILIDVG